MTGSATTGAGAGRPRFDDVAVGDVLPAQQYPLQRVDLIRYAGASGDFNVIHWNERVATSVGLPNVIAHGMLTMATVARLVTDWAGDPGAVVEYGTRFTRPVVVPHETGADVVFGGTVTELDHESRRATVEIVATCGDNAVLGRATAVVALA